MKKTTIVIAIMVWAVQTCYAQKPNLSALSPEAKQQYDKYMLQQKRSNKTGFILLGGGLALSGIGLVVGINGTLETLVGGQKEKKVVTGLVMFYTGVAAMVGSIPCFIIGGSKKRKAELLLKGETAQFNFSPNGQMGYAAVGLRVRL